MAGSKVSNFAIGDSNIQSVMLTLDKTFKGQHQVSLTNYDTTAESQVAAGSVIEIGGALYKFDSNESITGSPSDGTVYIMAVPSGDSVTCAYTNTAPTWSDSKQGWYGTGGTANNRYLEFIMTRLSSAYQFKNALVSDNSRRRLSAFGLFKLSADVSFSATTELSFDVKHAEQNLSYSTATKKLTIQEEGLYNIEIYPKLSGTVASPGYYITTVRANYIYDQLSSFVMMSIAGVGASASTFSGFLQYPIYGQAGNISYFFKAGTVISPKVTVSGTVTSGTQNANSYFLIKKID